MATVDLSDARSLELLERSESLDALGRWLAETSRARGRLGFVAGEAGVGKTALLRRFCAEHPHAEVYWGSCERLFTPAPLGPFVAIAEAAGGDLSALLERGVAPHEFVRAFIAALAGRRPAVVVIEDLHWADEGTLDAIKLLARRLGALSVLVLASFRDDQLGPLDPLQIVLGELAGADGVERMSLSALSRHAVREMARPFGVDEDSLFERTGGNPFFVTEVLAGGDADIPVTVRDAVLARAAHLGGAARRLLDVAAVVPGRTELWLLEAVAPEELTHLDECLGSGVLRADGRLVTFRHELGRAAIEEAIAPHRRVALHRSVLAALSASRRPVDPARLSHHAEAAGDQDAVLEYAPVAGARAAVAGAHLQAAEQYERALRAADALDLERQAELYDRLAYERHVADEDLTQALAAAQAALALRRALGQRLQEGVTLAFIARLLWFVGRAQAAEVAARQAVAILEVLPASRQLAMAYADVARLASLAHKLEEARVWALKALELAERVGAQEIIASALNTLGTVQLRDGLEEGWTTLRRSLELAEASRNDDDVARALVNLAGMALELRGYERAAEFIERGIEYTSERDLWAHRGFLLATRARWNLEQGHWDDATGDVELTLRPARAMPLIRVAALVVAGLVRARRGQAGAWIALDEALSLAVPEELQQIGPVAAARAEAAWLAQDLQRIERATEAAFALACERRSPQFAGELAYWRFKAGIVEEVPGWAAEPYRLQIQGEWAVAASRWAAVGCAYEAALALSESGEVEATRRALSEFQRLGAVPAARAVAQCLRRLGLSTVSRGPRRSTLANPAQLTTRQLEILRLLSRGLTNAEIATHLYISPRTVNHHVSAVLGKLGVNSRREAAATATRLGIAEM